ERGPATQEWFINEFATLRVIQDRPSEQLNRLLCWVIELFFLRSAHDHLGRGGVPDCCVLAGFSKPGRVLLTDVPARLMLKPIVRPGERSNRFSPNDLLVVDEANSQ